MLMCATVPTDFSVFLTTQRSSEVGIPFTLTCTVTLSHRVMDSSISIQWQGPFTDEQETVYRVSDSSSIVIERLNLNPLTLARGGDYTCTAVYRVVGYSIAKSDTESVIPISELSSSSASL